MAATPASGLSLQTTSTGVVDKPPETSNDSTTAPTPQSLERFISLTRRDARDRLDAPPPLEYNLRDHKTSLAIFTMLVLAECFFVPIALYYGLRFGTHLRSGERDASRSVGYDC
jgi:hypothetical protein